MYVKSPAFGTRALSFGIRLCRRAERELSLLDISHLKVKVNVKDTALDFTVPTGGADLRFLALQPGSAMGGVGGQPSCACAHPSCLPSPDFSRYPFRAGSTLAKLTESRH